MSKSLAKIIGIFNHSAETFRQTLSTSLFCVSFFLNFTCCACTAHTHTLVKSVYLRTKKNDKRKKISNFSHDQPRILFEKFFFLSFQKSFFQSQVRSIKSYRFLSFTQQILMCNLNQIVGIVLLLLLLLYFSSTMWSCV